MTEIYGLFDAANPMDPDRVYTSEAFARLFRAMMRDGIVHNDGTELAVGPTVPAAMSVSVGTGMALIQGRYYINDSDLMLNVEAADPSHPRIDRVVVRLEATPGRTIHAVVKKGTPAPSPVPPGLTRTAETWELSLAQVRVEAGATSIVAGKITDERGNASLCGVAAPAYVPSSQVEVVGAMNMQGHALTGLPAPSGATDAARKGYVDTEIAGKIGGFGISQIAIDADKNWNGKNITNVGGVYAGKVSAKIIPEIIASDEVRASSPSEVAGARGAPYTKMKEITIGEVCGSENSVRVKYDARTNYHPDVRGYAYVRVYVNDVAKSDELAITSMDWKSYSVDVTGIKTGDKVQLYLRSPVDQFGYISGFKVCYDLVVVPLPPATTATL